MKRFNDKRPDFYVVQFIKLPFEGIDDYVCVPYTWVALVRATDQKAVVAYPTDEDPFDTRDRVKRKERYDDTWPFFLATVKHESNNYSDAEDWIATRNDNVPLVEEKLKVTDTQSRISLNKKLCSVNQSHSLKSNDDPREPLPGTSTKRPALSEPKKKIYDKWVKLKRKSQSSSVVANDTNAVPGCSRRDESTIIQDNPSKECVNQMKRTSKNRRAFCVVQFIDLPFEGIDDYVCVPSTWLIVQRVTNEKAVVAYPNDENPSDTRDRAKRRERYGDKWKFYIAYVKYESDTHRYAEYWIAARKYNRPLTKEESRITDTQPRFTLNKKLHSVNQSDSSRSNDNPKPMLRTSTKRPALSEAMKQFDGKRFKLSKSAQSSSAVASDASAEPGCSRWGQSIINQDNQSMECARTEETAAASNGETSSSQRTNVNLQESIPMQEQQELNMPQVDVDTPTAVINDVNEVQHSSIMEQPLFYIKVLSQFEKRPGLVQGPRLSVACPVEMTCNNQELPSNDDLHCSMNRARRLVPIQKPVAQKTRLMNIATMCPSAAQNPSNLMDETESISMRSVAEQTSVITQNSVQDGPRVLKMQTGNSRDQTAPLRNIAISSQEIQHVPKINVKRFHEVAAVNPRNVLQSVNNIASGPQHLPSSSHERPSFVRRLAEHQSSQAQEQYIAHSHQNQYLRMNQDNFEQDTLRGSTESNNDDHHPNSRAIDMRIPSIRQNSTQPSNPMYQTSELPQQRQSQPNQQDSQRQPQRPKIRNTMFINPINNRKIPTLQGVTKKTRNNTKSSKVLNSIRQAILSTHNTYLRNVQQLQASHSETILDNERLRNVKDNEISTDEAPVETTNNVHCTGIASGRNFADRPTAAQNSTSPSHQTHPRLVLEQQMLDHFATLFTQMGSTLRYTCDMYNNLRSSILETAKMYKKLLYSVKRHQECLRLLTKDTPK